MQITWHGQFTVKITSKTITVILDPYGPSAGLTPFRAKADIVALSNPAFSEMSHLSGIQGDPFIVNTPGEYSIKGTTLNGIAWRGDEGSERSLLRWNIEDMTLLQIGSLNRELTDEELAEIEKAPIDILIIPVGGGAALDTKQALNMVSTIEPKVVIPIHYHLPNVREKLASVDLFAKEMGISSSQKEKKYSIRASKLPQEDVQTVLLTP